MNNNNRGSLAPIGFELLEVEFQRNPPPQLQSSFHHDSTYYPAAQPDYQSFNQNSYASAYPAAQPDYQSFNQNNYASAYPAAQPPQQYFNQFNYQGAQPSQFNYEYSNNTEPAAIVASIPMGFRDAYDSLVKNDKIENFLPDQDFYQIKRNYSISNKFIDNQFRANNDSVFFTSKFKNYLQQCGKFPYRSDQIEWKRAKDLYSNAHFVLDKQNKFMNMRAINESNYKNFFHTTDLDQGSLGNCWFISAATGIIQNYDLFKRVVPFDNSLENLEYCGAFHFRFWVYGEWKDVVIDDFLPVGPDNKLIFSKNRETPNEFWCALFEKAYAKLCGGYESLDGGFTTDALIDMSGGIEEVFKLNEIRKTLYDRRNPFNHGINENEMNHVKLWEILLNARKKQSVIGSNIELLESDSVNEVKLSNGLVRGHAYICTKIAEIDIHGENHRIMRLYNPWGNEVEWNGKWSDNSVIWRSVEPNVKDKLELRIDKDGEFWISFEDFCLNFDYCQICNLTPHLFETNLDSSTQLGQNPTDLSNLFSMWQSQIFHDKWILGVSAGGRGEPNRSKFWRNPKIGFYINQIDLASKQSCWVIIGLMQKFTRQKRVALQTDSAEEYIQFRIFKVKDETAYFRYLENGEAIDNNLLERLGSSGAYLNKREVTCRFSLTQGAYIIIPSCYDEDKEGEFLVRIFTEMPLNQKNCKSLNPNRKSQAMAEDRNLENDLNNLSLGGSNVVNNFLLISNDLNRNNQHITNDSNPRHKPNRRKPQVSCNQM